MADFAHDLSAHRRLNDLQKRIEAGGGSPHNGSMEDRVAKLEEFASDTRERFARVETKLDHIEKEVSQFKWWIVGQIIAGMLAVIGTGIAIQQMTVATFQGAAQVAKDAAQVPQVAQPQQPPIIINVPPTAPSQKP